jgi:hypothetical protein
MRLSVHKRENQYIKLHILYRVASASFLTLSSPKERHPVWASDRKPAAGADDQRRRSCKHIRLWPLQDAMHRNLCGNRRRFVQSSGALGEHHVARPPPHAHSALLVVILQLLVVLCSCRSSQ